MSPAESPFPCSWWGIDLEDSGLRNVQPDVGTYGCYDFAALPPVPFEMRGDFDWLARAPKQQSNIGQERAIENSAAIKTLREACNRLNVRLPEPFVRFMEIGSLQKRIRSNTDCFVDLCPEPIPSPVSNGYPIRFLADSQGCVFWYLYLTPGSADHAVVASSGFYGTEAEQWDEEPPDPSEIIFCAESFETFVCRFWLENEIWYATYEKKPLLEVGRKYIEDHLSRQH